MSGTLKSRLGLLSKSVLSTSVDMALLTRSSDIPDEFEFPHDEGSQTVPHNFFNMSVSLSHRLGSGSTMTHMLTYLHKNNEMYSYDPGYTPAPNDPYYPLNNDFNTNQFQYYLGTYFGFGKSWVLGLAGHIATVGAPEYQYTQTWYRARVQYQYIKNTYWNFDYAFSASILKNFKRASIGAEMAIMSMNNQFSFQPTGMINLYPLGNLNLYTSSRFSYSIKDNTGTFFQEQKLGFKALKHLWLEGTYFSGGISGFTLDNSSLFYNGLESVNSMAGGKMIIPTNKKFSLSLGYQNRKMTNYFYNNNDITQKSNGLELNYSLFFMTLLWTL